MSFLSNGDFGFPFELKFYVFKNFFLWSYQNGAVNPDGIMRMPGRLLHLLVFAGFGNLAFEYFLLGTSLIVVFISFYFFLKEVLDIKSTFAKLVGSLLFTFNPLFLGNISKVGLIFGAAMLPLIFVMIHKFAVHQKFRYLFFCVLLLNLSLIHPFTFTINLLAGIIYFIVKIHKKPTLLISGKNILRILLAGIFFILINAYFLLPIVSMRSVNKDVLLDTAVSTPTDYTALVDVLNTGDIFTGLSLSKNVVKDYDFYNHDYFGFYLLGVFGFYGTLIFLYITHRNELSKGDKRIFILLLTLFLVLLLLAAVNFLGAGTLIKLLINTPFGWIFRSPLKWQLYIPITIFTALAILLKYTRQNSRFHIYFLLALTFILANGYIMKDIYQKLLTPRNITHFAALERKNFQHDNLLFATNEACLEYQLKNPQVMTELNQVLSSKNIQVKRVSAGSIEQLSLNSFDYLLSCKGTASELATQSYNFNSLDTFADKNFELYENKAKQNYIYSVEHVFGLSSNTELGQKHDFVTKSLGKNFDFVIDPEKTYPTIPLADIFEQLSPQSIQNKTLIGFPGQYDKDISIMPHNLSSPLFYKQDTSSITFSSNTSANARDYRSLTKDSTVTGNNRQSNQLELKYFAPGYDYRNLVSNPSLEEGLWNRTVGDCYNYDDSPQIKMSLSSTTKSDGNKALYLGARSHVACTSPEEIEVVPGTTYLLSFDYNSPTGSAGYTVGFKENPTSSIDARLIDKKKTGWQKFHKVVKIPENANSLKLSLKAFPGSGGSWSEVYFDNLHVIAVPDIQGKLYATTTSLNELESSSQPVIEYNWENPSRTTINVTGATESFFIGTGESYNPHWKITHIRSSLLGREAKSLEGATHIKLNGTMNGWYINLQQTCKSIESNCTRKKDGTYDLVLVAQFAPQRWFYLGALISAVSLVTGTIFVLLSYKVKPATRRRANK
jgi:hypothetical protein